MWVGEPGKLSDRLEFLGTREICLYLLKGKEAMIIGGGMSYVAPSLERQFSQLDFNAGSIRYLVVLHSHFDHCGAVPYLKRKFPQAQVVASAYSKEVFSKEKVVTAIANANRKAIQGLGLCADYERLNLKFDGVRVERVVGEGDVIDLGEGIRVHFLETPGHTKCSLAAYVPELKALFPSDAAPVPLPDGSGLSFPSPQCNFSSYVESLKKLATYEAEVCAFEHNGAFLGEQARNVMWQGLKETEKFRSYVMALYRQLADIDKVTEAILSDIQQRKELTFLDSEVRVSVTKACVRKIVAT